MNSKVDKKVLARQKRKVRIHKKIRRQLDRPFLVVFRSNTHIYAQLIEPKTGNVIVAVSTLALSKKQPGVRSNIAGAELVGKEIARLALEKNVKSVIFDRNGYLYHGKITVLADAARKNGLDF